MYRRRMITGAALAAAAAGLAEEARAEESLIGQFAARLSAHDLAGFAALFAEDYVNHQLSAAAPPAAAGKSAKQASVDFFAARLAGIPDLAVTVEASVITPERVAASFVYSGTHEGTLFGVAATGRRLRFTSCDIFAVRDGRFVEHWGMGDIAGVMAQLRG